MKPLPSHPFVAKKIPWLLMWIGLGLGTAIALIVLAPAKWMALLLESATNKTMTLSSPQGTIWDGQGQLVVRLSSGKIVTIPTVIHWNISFSLNGIYVIMKDSNTLENPVTMSFQPKWMGYLVNVSQARINIPLDWLVDFGAPWNTLDLSGVAYIQNSPLSLLKHRAQVTTDGHVWIDLVEIASGLAPINPIGSYQIKLDAKQPFSFDVQTIKGLINVTGHGDFSAEHIHFNGTMRSTSDQPNTLIELFSPMGTNKNGQIFFNIQ